MSAIPDTRRATAPAAFVRTAPSIPSASFIRLKTASKGRIWAGRIVSAVPVLMLFMGATMKLTHNPALVKGFVEKFGYPEGALTPIGIVELACALLYAVPATRLVGAALITAFLGGATATHVRAGEPFAVPVLLGVVVWVGLYLRDEKLATLLPFGRSRGG